MRAIVFFVLCLAITRNAFGQNESILRGNQYYQQSQFELAEAQYRKALEIDPANTTAQFNLANALQKQKKYKEAIDLTERTAASATADKKIKAQSYYNQGVAHTRLKDLEASIESYKKALRLDPSDQQARENLQKALLELKKKQQQQQQQQQKQQSSMSQSEAERKLKLLQQRERELQQRMRSRKQGAGQSQDW